MGGATERGLPDERAGTNTYFVKPTNFQALVALCRQIAGYWQHGVKPRLER